MPEISTGHPHLSRNRHAMVGLMNWLGATEGCRFWHSARMQC